MNPPKSRTRLTLWQSLTIIGLLIGGALLGILLADWIAPGSSLAMPVSALLFPVSIILGFFGWLGLAILHLPMAIFRWITGRKQPDHGRGDQFIPPGSLAFLPVTVFCSALVGLICGLVPGGWTVFAAVPLYVILGFAFGLLLWRLAKTGLLPFPEE